MFTVDYATGAVTMHQGDTGSYKVTATRKSGIPWTERDRMLLTIWSGAEPLIQRLYRLDDAFGLGNGVVLIEFHNSDTDKIPTGNYVMERRYIVDPIWDVEEGGMIPTGRCENALTASAKIVEGPVVRTKIQTTFALQTIYGEV